MTHVDNNTESRKSKHLTYGEMQKIEAYKALDLSNRKIATLLGRSPQTINNAINTASVTQKSQQKQNGKIYTYYKTVYSADLHYDIYLQNRSNCGRRPKWVESDRFTEWADQKMLEDKWSPDTVIHEAKGLFDSALVPSTSPFTIGLIVASCVLKTSTYSRKSAGNHEPLKAEHDEISKFWVPPLRSDQSLLRPGKSLVIGKSILS